MAKNKKAAPDNPDEAKDNLLMVLVNKPGFAEWLEKTDFAHMLESDPADSEV